MKVALVHDYLKEYGGAEVVLEALHEIFPSAPVFTAYYSPKSLGIHAERFRDWDIRTSVLQKLPFANKLISPLRILAPVIFEGFDFKEYDLVISSCSIYFSKAIITKPEALHISYIHTPPRYLYGYTTSFNYKKNIFTRIGAEIINHFLRIYDFETSQRPDILVANSKNVAERIKKFYRRKPVVVYPPVDVANLKSITQSSKAYYLSIGRLVRGKGVDMVIEACKKLGLSLKVAGIGPELGNLKKLAEGSSNIEFLGPVSDDEKAKLYIQAKALILAAEDEDFGITPVEAMAAGTPVIAPKSGGFKETVLDQKTGILYYLDNNQVTVDTLVAGIKRFSGLNHLIREQDCVNQAEKFSKERFKKEMMKLIETSRP